MKPLITDLIRDSTCLQMWAGRIISKLCAVPYTLAQVDQRNKVLLRYSDSHHQSIIHVNFKMYYVPVLIKGSKKCLRSPAPSCSGCASFDSSDPVQV